MVEDRASIDALFAPSDELRDSYQNEVQQPAEMATEAQRPGDGDAVIVEVYICAHPHCPPHKTSSPSNGTAGLPSSCPGILGHL